MCVCVCERETERDREREYVCVCNLVFPFPLFFHFIHLLSEWVQMGTMSAIPVHEFGRSEYFADTI